MGMEIGEGGDQGAKSKGNKPWVWSTNPKPQIVYSIQGGGGNERGAKSEELGVSNPMSPPNLVTKVCLSLCVCICVIKMLCVYVCVSMIEVRFNNETHAHSLTSIQFWTCVCIFKKSQSLGCMNLNVYF